MKGSPSALILTFDKFFEYKERFYSALSGKEAYLVASPFVVKAYCYGTPLLISVPPGSLVTYEEEVLDLGACIASEYFWFEGWKLGWRLASLPDRLRPLAKSAGFEEGEGREVRELKGSKGSLKLRKPWHPAARGLEEGLECEGGSAEGDVLATCNGKEALVDAGEVIYVGTIKEAWRLLPALAYASRL